jgi:hypothetical protein
MSGRRKKEEGRSSNSNGFSDEECPNRLGGCYKSVFAEVL